MGEIEGDENIVIEPKFKVLYKFTDHEIKERIKDGEDNPDKYYDFGITKLDFQKRSFGLMIEDDFVQAIDEYKNLIFLQITEFPDKNKKNISIGDILTVQSKNSVMASDYDYQPFQVVVEDLMQVHQFICGFQPEDIEIIGNKYFNPELLAGVEA